MGLNLSVEEFLLSCLLLFVYNANESTLAAGALFRKYVSVSKKTDGSSNGATGRLCVGGAALATTQVWANEGVDVETSVAALSFSGCLL